MLDSGQGDRLAGWRAQGIIILMIANKWQPKAGFVSGRPCKWFPNLPPKVLRRSSRQSWDPVIFKNQKSSAACEVFYKRIILINSGAVELFCSRIMIAIRGQLVDRSNVSLRASLLAGLTYHHGGPFSGSRTVRQQGNWSSRSGSILHSGTNWIENWDGWLGWHSVCLLVWFLQNKSLRAMSILGTRWLLNFVTLLDNWPVGGSCLSSNFTFLCGFQEFKQPPWPVRDDHLQGDDAQNNIFSFIFPPHLIIPFFFCFPLLIWDLSWSIMVMVTTLSGGCRGHLSVLSPINTNTLGSNGPWVLRLRGWVNPTLSHTSDVILWSWPDW